MTTTAALDPWRPNRMPTLATLALFSVAVLGLMVSPGPNMALVISHSLSLGVRGGLVSAAGIFVADLIMTGLVCAGVAALFAAWPPAFDALRWLGAGYLVWLGVKALRTWRTAVPATPAQGSLRRAFEAAIGVSLLNPKALLFFLVFLPQFVDAARGPVGGQLFVLGLTLSTLALVFHGLLGVCAGAATRLLRERGPSLRWLDRLQAGLLFGLALRLLLLERPIRI
jgi:threonine/homoserine/homoserine lactone efflux protein